MQDTNSRSQEIQKTLDDICQNDRSTTIPLIERRVAIKTLEKLVNVTAPLAWFPGTDKYLAREEAKQFLKDLTGA